MYACTYTYEWLHFSIFSMNSIYVFCCVIKLLQMFTIHIYVKTEFWGYRHFFVTHFIFLNRYVISITVKGFRQTGMLCKVLYIRLIQADTDPFFFSSLALPMRSRWTSWRKICLLDLELSVMWTMIWSITSIPEENMQSVYYPREDLFQKIYQ